MIPGMKNRNIVLAAAVLSVALVGPANAACKQKRSRDPSFIELAVPDDAVRPKGAQDFSFVTDDVTYDQLVAKVGPPDASQGGGRMSYFIWCLADETEVSVATRDRVAIESIRHDGKSLFKRAKKKK
jgi:hypothetical protein